MADLPEQTQHTSMTVFDDEGFDATIRRVRHEGRGFFSVVDVIGVLTDSTHPRRYWTDMKRRLAEDEGFVELYANCVQLKMPSPDGKQRLTDAADTQTLLRIIQSVPSSRAEPIKQWLARVGAERLREMEDPSRAVERARKDYERLGYATDWIERRLQGQVIRNELTQEWSERGASEAQDFARLTDTIHRGTFDLSGGEHKQVKGVRPQANLRDHETVLELLLTAIGEETAKEMHRERDSRGYPDLQRDAHEAGAVGGATRRDIEARLGRGIVSARKTRRRCARVVSASCKRRCWMRQGMKRGMRRSSGRGQTPSHAPFTAAGQAAAIAARARGRPGCAPAAARSAHGARAAPGAAVGGAPSGGSAVARRVARRD